MESRGNHTLVLSSQQQTSQPSSLSSLLVLWLLLRNLRSLAEAVHVAQPGTFLFSSHPEQMDARRSASSCVTSGAPLTAHLVMLLRNRLRSTAVHFLE